MYTSDRSYIQYPLSEAADTAGVCGLAIVFTERYYISVDAHTVVKIFIVEFIILAVDRLWICIFISFEFDGKNTLKKLFVSLSHGKMTFLLCI